MSLYFNFNLIAYLRELRVLIQYKHNNLFYRITWYLGNKIKQSGLEVKLKRPKNNSQKKKKTGFRFWVKLESKLNQLNPPRYPQMSTRPEGIFQDAVSTVGHKQTQKQRDVGGTASNQEALFVNTVAFSIYCY